MTIFSTLPIPKASSSTTGNATSTISTKWDENVGEDELNKQKEVLMKSCRHSLSQHAIANGYEVLGVHDAHHVAGSTTTAAAVSSTISAGIGDTTKVNRIKWNAKFDYPVCDVVSNVDGSVVAASTLQGTISLFKGHDGNILATRRLHTDDLSMSTPQLQFICTGQFKNIVNDALIILSEPNTQQQQEYASSTQSNMSNREMYNEFTLSATQSTTRSKPRMNIVLVTGIDGTSLNSSDRLRQASAARKMSIDEMKLNLSNQSRSNVDNGVETYVTCLNGCFIAKDVVRFISVDSTGSITIHDFDMVEKRAIIVTRGLQFDTTATSTTEGTTTYEDKYEQNESWTFDTNAGIQIGYNDYCHYFTMVVSCGCRSKLCWFHIESLQMLGQYEFPKTIMGSDRRFLSTKIIKSCSSRNALAVAVAIQSSTSPSCGSNDESHGGGSEIQIIQAIIDETSVVDIPDSPSPLPSPSSSSGDNDENTVVNNETDLPQTEVKETSPPKRSKRTVIRIYNSHLVYSIPMQDCLEHSFIESVHLSGNHGSKDYAYTFRCKIKYGNHTEWKEFQTGKDEVIGKFRFLLAREQFDDANELLSGVSTSQMNNPFGSIHPSEVALWKLRRILSNEKVILSSQNIEETTDCLHRLKSGAVAGGTNGVQCLLQASQCLYNWPSRVSTTSIDMSTEGIQLRDYRKALTAMSMTLSNVLEACAESSIQDIQEEQQRIQFKISTMKLIETLLAEGSRTKQQIQLRPPLTKVQCPSDLFRTLVVKGAFNVAERARQLDAGKSITAEHVASSLMCVDTNFDPQLYSNWLKDVVIPNLTVNHKMLSSLMLWSCQTADKFDATYEEHASQTIDSAIHLLRTIHGAISQLYNKMYSSFAYYSPFADKEQFMSTIPSVIGVSEDEILDRTDDSSLSNTNCSRVISTNQIKSIPSNPTVMEIDPPMKRKQRKNAVDISTDSNEVQSLNASLHRHKPNDYSTIYACIHEEDMNCVEIKLSQAVLIREARNLGLPKKSILLKDFDDKGGSSFLAKELVRGLSQSSTTTVGQNNGNNVKSIQEFCRKANIDFDLAVLQYAEEVCDIHPTGVKILSETIDLARMCSNPTVKCQITLKVLRAALLCNDVPPCLASLSSEALEWATEEALRSELQEATRLLSIDRIVRQYCGNGAQEFFRVSDIRHASRLLNHVCRYIDESTVLQDAFSLCDAFTHLSRGEACVLILQRAAVASPPNQNHQGLKYHSRAEQCGDIIGKVCDFDFRTAENVATRVCMYLSETIRTRSLSLKEIYDSKRLDTIHQSLTSFYSSACSILSVMAKHSQKSVTETQHPTQLSMMGSTTWNNLFREFERLRDLHLDFGISLTLSELRRGDHHDLIKDLLNPSIELLKNDSRDVEIKLKDRLAKAKRGCTLLYGDDVSEVMSQWCKAVGSVSRQLVQLSDAVVCIKMLEISGVFNEMTTDSAFQAIVSIVHSLFTKAAEETYIISQDMTQSSNIQKSLSPMKCIVGAGCLLQDHILLHCPFSLLPSIVFLSSLTDVVTQVLIKTDCGIGESIEEFKTSLHEIMKSQQHLSLTPTSLPTSSSGIFNIPSLYPTWYKGDGLLLPPLEALLHCVAYCRQQLTSSSSIEYQSSNSKELYSFLGCRGAHAISLRMLAFASTLSLNVNNGLACKNDQHQSLMNDTIVNLAERSLGGSGTGIISGSIDSQQAVSHLLALPIKTSFKLYTRCLPTAMSRRDFQMILILSDIGLRACGSKSLYENDTSHLIGWKKQQNFISQCKKLSEKAYWWKILKACKVSFDPKFFDDAKKSSKESRTEDDPGSNKYIVDLLPKLINGASTFNMSPNLVHSLASDFVTAFNLKSILAPQKYVEFLLSWPGDEIARNDTQHLTSESVDNDLKSKDIRRDLVTCTTVVKEMLTLLPSKHGARSLVLRKCLIALENIDESGRDFERYSLILSLYHAELLNLISGHSEGRPKKAFLEEIQRIERRRDALAIISSFFRGKQWNERPLFQKCFLPFPQTASSQNKMNIKFSGVLGGFEKNEDVFDPLSPLQSLFEKNPTASLASSLSALCVPLGIPSGYIHSRVLLIRIGKAISLHGELPSFNNDVEPVIRKLKSPSDGTELAEWCMNKYQSNSIEKLQCLQLAVDCATKSSYEAEHQFRRSTAKEKQIAEDNMHEALETMKRLSSTKAALSDRMKVQDILNKERGDDPTSQIWIILSTILDKGLNRNGGNSNMSPEDFVETLLIESSKIAAEATLDKSICMSMDDFRTISRTVHRACKCLAEIYSHVKVGKIGRLLVRRWLCHGDDDTDDTASQNSTTQVKTVSTAALANLNDSREHELGHNNSMLLEEEDTVNFVMDLNKIASGNVVWSDDVGSVETTTEKSKAFTAEEETTALKPLSCVREKSEYRSSRVGLRVAYVMSFAEDFHIIDSGSKGFVVQEKENLQLQPTSSQPKEETKQYSKTSLNNNLDLIIEHARYLLKLVFSKSGSTLWTSEGSITSNKDMISKEPSISSSTTHNTTKRKGQNTGQALTFAMRYRALRAASVLCPEPVLQSAIKEENYFNRNASCTLQKCCFGSFLAMEIEAMGLPLPHSDLVQLSTMTFSSYARTLWRHHGRAECCGYKGRLMLLLLELALKGDSQKGDPSLVLSILTEITEIDLPRTMLLACECVARVDKLDILVASNNGETGKAIAALAKKLARRVCGEVVQIQKAQKTKTDNDQCEEMECLLTIDRLGKVVAIFSKSTVGGGELLVFVDEICKLATASLHSNRSVLAKGLLDIAVDTACYLDEQNGRNTAFHKISNISGGPSALQQRLGHSSEEIDGVETSRGDCFNLLLKLESHLMKTE